jgi:WD40 repeat protein
MWSNNVKLLWARELGVRAHYEPLPRGCYREPLWSVRAALPGTTEVAIGASRAFLYRLALCSVWDAHTGCVNTLCWNDSGTLCLSGSDDTRVKLWDLRYHWFNEDGELWLQSGRGMGQRSSIEPHDHELFVAAEDEHRHGRPLSERWRQRPLLSFRTGHSANIFDVKFVPSSSDRLILSCAGDHEVRISDLEKQTVRAVYCHTGRVKKLAVDRGSPSVFLSCAEDGTVRQFDMRQLHRHRCRRATRRSNGDRCCGHVLIDVNELDWTRLYASLPQPSAFSDRESTMRTRSMTGRRNPMIIEPSAELYSIKLHPLDGNLFLVAGSHEFVQLYDRRMLSHERGPVRLYAPQERRNAAEQHRREREAYRQVLLERERRVLRARRQNLRRVANLSDREDALEDTEPILGRLGRMLLQEMYESVSVTDVAFSRDGRQFLASYAHDGIYLFDTEPRKGYAAGEVFAKDLSNNSMSPDAPYRRGRSNGAHERHCPMPAITNPLADGGAERDSPPAAAQMSSESRPTTRRRAQFMRSQNLAMSGDVTIQADSLSERQRAPVQPQVMTSTTFSEHSEVSISHAIRPTGSMTGTGNLPAECIRATATSQDLAEGSFSYTEQTTEPSIHGRVPSQGHSEPSERTSPREAFREPIRGRAEACSLASRVSMPVFTSTSRRSVLMSADPSTLSHPRASLTTSRGLSPAEAATLVHLRGQTRSMPGVDGATSPADEDLEASEDWPRVPRWLTTRTSPEGSYVRCFLGHRNAITIKEVNFFGPNDEYVISGSDDGRVYLWDRYTGELLQAFQADRDVVNCVETHPYEPFLATAGIDSSIKLWRPEAPTPRRLRDLNRIVQDSTTYHRQEARPRHELRGAWLDMYELFYINLEPVVVDASGGRGEDQLDDVVSVHSLSDDRDVMGSGDNSDSSDAAETSDDETPVRLASVGTTGESRLELDIGSDPLSEQFLSWRHSAMR